MLFLRILTKLDRKLYILSHTFIEIFLLFWCYGPFCSIVHREQTPCITVVNNYATRVRSWLSWVERRLRACVARNTPQESRPNRYLLSVLLMVYCMSLTVSTSNWFMGTGRRRKVRLGKWRNVLRITPFCQQKSGKSETNILNILNNYRFPNIKTSLPLITQVPCTGRRIMNQLMSLYSWTYSLTNWITFSNKSTSMFAEDRI